MTHSDWIQPILFIMVLFGATPFLGHYIAGIMQRSPPISLPFLHLLEMASYRLCGVNAAQEMTWKQYAKALICFNIWGVVVLFFLQIVQAKLPLNPENFPSLSWPAAINSAVSFVSNTGWQAYAGETTISYFTQMSALTVQSFVSAATGLSTLFVVIRSVHRQATVLLGNFWVDLVRCVVYLFLPLSTLFAFILIAEGAVQSFSPYVHIETVEGQQQTIPLGPIASQVAIKRLGSGGGVFRASAAHPFENPTPLTNFLEQLAIILIPVASVYAFGVAIRKKKKAIVILSVMSCLWGIAVVGMVWAESEPNAVLHTSHVLEGKETRFGIIALWTANSSAASNGAVNTSLDSASALSGGIALFNIILGSVIFGGVGVGLCSMFFYVLLTAFASCLLGGRIPEYLGKRIEGYELRWVLTAIFLPSALILSGAALSTVYSPARLSMVNHGPHALTEWLFAAASTTKNNGSAFASVDYNTTFYNIFFAVMMLLGRLAVIFPALAIAGSLVQKRQALDSGHVRSDSIAFAWLLFLVILFLAALIFLPALFLGPIVEHLLMQQGRAF